MAEDWRQWPLMEEEILIVENRDYVLFNFPVNFYTKYLAENIKKLRTLKIYSTRDSGGGQRVIVILDKNTALELRAWLTLTLSEDENFFITDIEEI